MEGLTGDFRKLRGLSEGFERVGDSFPRLVRVVGDATLDAVVEGHTTGRDPSGAAWASTTDGRRALQGGFAASWRLSTAGNVVTLATSHEGAGAHQRGMVITPKTKRALAFVIGGAKVFARKVTLPQRRMHPSGGTLEGWAPRLRVAVVDELVDALGVTP